MTTARTTGPHHREEPDMTNKDRTEFSAFCANATTSQLREIIRKEAAARRVDFMQLAQAELAKRGEA
jgi:hypothetical protein